MSIEKATAHLEKIGYADRIMVFETSSATVDLAAAAVGCEPERIAKTLSFDVNGETVLIVCAGDCRIDNPKYKAQFHTKAKMLAFEEAEPRIGHAVGGICPFGINEGVKVYLDESLRRFDIVYPAAGSSNSAVKLAIDELEKCAAPCEWIDVCKY